MDSSGKKRRARHNAGRRRSRRHTEPEDPFEFLMEHTWMTEEEIARLRDKCEIPSEYRATLVARLRTNPDLRDLYQKLEQLPPTGYADLILWEFEAMRKAEAISLDTLLKHLLDGRIHDWAKSLYGGIAEDRLCTLLTLYWGWFDGLNERDVLACITGPRFKSAMSTAHQRSNEEFSVIFG